MAATDLNCPACARVGTLRPDFEIYYWRENRLQFLRCDHCGLSFAHPFLTSELISQGNQALVQFYQRGRTWDQEFYDARKAYLRGKVLASRLSRWKPRGRLLDLGCYNGFVGYGVAQHSDWTVEGLEIAPELARFVETRLGLRCHLGTLQEAQIPDASYDWIICHDLIEHINETQNFLSAITRILKPGGRIEIITPNAIQDLAYARRASAAGRPMTMLLNHIMMFSPKSLELALSRTGLKINQLYTYDLSHTPKDMGWFGLGKPGPLEERPSMLENSAFAREAGLIPEWSDESLAQLRSHPKTSALYGFLKHRLPEALRIRVPARIGLGHEIYAVAEKPV